jgi:hypothetical protein
MQNLWPTASFQICITHHNIASLTPFPLLDFVEDGFHDLHTFCKQREDQLQKKS